MYRLSDSPVVFVGNKHKDLHGKLAVIRSKYGYIVGTTIYSPNINQQELGEFNLHVSEYIIRELGDDPDKLDASIYSEGLFVYGTLLPKYITPKRQVGTCWGGLDAYPWVRTVARGYRLVYHGLPYAVRSPQDEVLGVTYLGVSKAIEKRIDLVEFGSGYSKIETEGFIIENYPLFPRLKIRLYIHKMTYGRTIPTMLFGELFMDDASLYWYKRKTYFDVLEGNCGIIITAPHGGLYRPPNSKPRSDVEADENTFELAKLIVNNIYERTMFKVVPNAVLGRIHRSIVDLNRSSALLVPIGSKYHETIKRIAEKYPRVLLVDIHGMHDRANRDIEIGTYHGKTIHGDLNILETIRRSLKSHNIKVKADVELIGQFTVLNHSKERNVYALQIEISRELRLRKNLETTSKILADAILSTYHYIINI